MRSFDALSGSVEPSSANEDVPLPPRLPPRSRGPPRPVRRVLRFGMLAIAILMARSLSEAEWQARRLAAEVRALETSSAFIGEGSAFKNCNNTTTYQHTPSTLSYLRATTSSHPPTSSNKARISNSHARSERRCLRRPTAICMRSATPGTHGSTTDIISRSRMWRVLRNTKQMCADRVSAFNHQFRPISSH